MVPPHPPFLVVVVSAPQSPLHSQPLLTFFLLHLIITQLGCWSLELILMWKKGNEMGSTNHEISSYNCTMLSKITHVHCVHSRCWSKYAIHVTLVIIKFSSSNVECWFVSLYPLKFHYLIGIFLCIPYPQL